MLIIRKGCLKIVQIHEEENKSEFEGTIIDIETIGNFRREYADSRQYQDIIPVIFGFIDNKGLKIFCAKSPASIAKLKAEIRDILSQLKRPFYAFNSDFERGSLFHQLGEEVPFERELNNKKYEKKQDAVSALGIFQYDDPFNDNGLLCREAWVKGELDKAIAHNRSCLLKERDILLKRGFREPDSLEMVGNK